MCTCLVPGVESRRSAEAAREARACRDRPQQHGGDRGAADEQAVRRDDGGGAEDPAPGDDAAEGAMPEGEHRGDRHGQCRGEEPAKAEHHVGDLRQVAQQVDTWQWLGARRRFDRVRHDAACRRGDKERSDEQQAGGVHDRRQRSRSSLRGEQARAEMCQEHQKEQINNGVSAGPGAILLTLILCLAISLASVFVKAMTPPLAAE